MIAHIEKGQCKKIDHNDLQGHIQHKKIIRSILEQPERTIGKAPSEKAKLRTQSLQMDTAPRLDDVALSPPLVAPKPTNGASSNVAKEMDGLGANLASISLAASSSVSAAQQTGNKSSHEPQTKRQPNQASGPAKPKNNAPTNNKSSTGTTEANSDTVSTDKKQSSWTANSSTALFPKAKPTPVTDDWEATLEARQEQTQPQNMFRVRFWDPLSDDYNPDRFYDEEMEVYKCPIPDCGYVLN